jgi:hypothetical protein
MPMPSLCPEMGVLVECARVRLDEARVASLRRHVAGVTDWPELLELAERHRLVGLLHSHLHEHASDLVPTELQRALRRRAMSNATANLLLASELVAVLKLLEAEEIAVLPYKGPLLAQSAYGNLALREMKDLDLLLRPADVRRAIRLLGRHGYRLTTPLLRGLVTLGLEYQATLVRDDDETIIELHWTIVPRSVSVPFGLEELWPHRLETAIAGYRVHVPSHEDMLTILCVHGCKHRWMRLEWVCGTAELLRTKPLLWERVLDRSEEWHAGRMLRTGLLLAHRLLDAPLPDGVLRIASGDETAAELAEMAMEGIFVPTERTLDTRELRAFQMRMHERIGDRVRALWYRRAIDGARLARRMARGASRLVPQPAS